MIGDEPELITDICDFITLFYVILGCKFSECSEWSIEIHLGTGMQFAISNTFLV